MLRKTSRKDGRIVFVITAVGQVGAVLGS